MNERRRAQSETIGMVLLLAVAVIGSTAIVLFGSTALQETDDSMRTSNVENSMKQLDARASRVAIGGSEAQEVTVPTSGDAELRGEPDAGWIRVTVTNRTSNATQTILNRSMGAVVYERGEKRVAYQGGGVWRKVGNDTVMLSSPEFHFQGQTLTLPIVSVDREGALGDTIRIESNGSAERVFPGTTNLTNPIAGNKQVNVTIHSEYYRGWASFFTTRAGGVVNVNHANQTVTLELVTKIPQDPSRVEGGVYSTTAGPGTTVEVRTSSFLNSYNSTEYDNSNPSNDLAGPRNESEIVLGGKLRLKSDAQLFGDAWIGNQVKVQGGGNAKVRGDVLCYKAQGAPSDQGCADPGDTLGNVTTADEKPPDPATVEELFGFTVDEKVDELRAENDNSNVSAIEKQGSTFEFKDNGPLEIGPGQYYLDNLDETGTIIKLNLTKNGGGDIVIGLDGKFDLDSDAALCIIHEDQFNNRSVSIFQNGQGGSEIQLDGGADVLTVHKDNVDDASHDCDDDKNGDDGEEYNGTHMSNKFWHYSEPGIDADLDQKVDFTGVIYAPDTNSQVAAVSLTGGRVYGGVVAHVDAIDNNNRPGAIFYDQALKSVKVDQTSGIRPVKVSYLHISVTRVNVSSSG